jgi:hypothetical protein
MNGRLAHLWCECFAVSSGRFSVSLVIMHAGLGAHVLFLG